MGGFLYKNVSAISRFPTKFHDSVFFADYCKCVSVLFPFYRKKGFLIYLYCSGWINYFPLSSPPVAGAPSAAANIFLTGLSAPVTLIESPDGKTSKKN
jgi:hypothetical protein